MTGEHEGDGWSGRTWGCVAGVALVLLPMLIRVQTPLELNPRWDGDPLTQDAAVIGLTPSLSLIGDMVTLAGALLLFLCGPRRGTRAAAPALCVALGAWGCLWWTGVGGFRPHLWVTAGAWVSGVVGAFSLWWAGADRRVRLLAFAVVVGAVGLLAAKGAYQVLVEHPVTVEAFKRDRLAVLARNGWSPDSPMARAYERRLMQSEATGWFGFANVYASFAAMGVVAFTTLAAGAWLAGRGPSRDDDRRGGWPMGICAAGGAASAVALVMAGAKGGFAACALGLLAAGVLGWMAVRRRALRGAWLIGPAAVAAPLAAVVARGVVGERIGELSLLFRWFYMQAAARIVGANPAHGAGPDGFQAAYTLAKNPLSPEDVTSPHSVLWDWAACLGVAGVAWCVWLLWLSARVGPGALAELPAEAAGAEPADGAPASVGPSQRRPLMRAACLIIAATMVAIPMQYAALLPEEALGVRVAGLVGWCVLSCGVIGAAGAFRGWTVALAGASIVLLAHAQIEVTGMWPQSCGLVLAVIGLAASGLGERSGPGRLDGAVRGACAAGCVAAGLALAGPLASSIRGEGMLADAYRALQPARDLRARLAAAQQAGSPEAASLARQLRSAEPGLVHRAVGTLPDAWPQARSASQLAMQLAEAHRLEGFSDSPVLALVWAVRAVDLVTGGRDDALTRLTSPAERPTPQEAAAAFARLASKPASGVDSVHAGWAATVCTVAADGGYAPSGRAWRELAVKYLRRARAEDPYNPVHAQRLMEALVTLNDPAAAQAAKDLLAVDDLQRLDRAARGLTAGDRARAERVASGR